MHKVATKWAWFASAVGSEAFTTAGRDTGVGIQHALVIAYTYLSVIALLVAVKRNPAESGHLVKLVLF